MRNAPSIDVTLGPSWIAAAFAVVAAVATLVLLLVLPIVTLTQAILGTLVMRWVWDTVRKVTRRPGAAAPVSLHLGADRVLVVRYPDGRAVAGHLRSTTYVSSLVTTVAWRPDGAWRTRTVLILPDMLPAEDFRRLRILLRYARSAVAQGAPPSHA